MRIKPRILVWIFWAVLVYESFYVAFSNCAFASSNSETKREQFYQICQIEGKHWFRSPLGTPFFAIGVSHVRFTGHHCERLGFSPYNQYCNAKYFSNEKWAETTAERLRKWGFNTIGELSDPLLKNRGFASTAFFPFGYAFALRDGLPTPSHKTYVAFPNVFNPDWVSHCKDQANKLCTPHVKDSELLGYYIDNELPWLGPEGREWGLFSEAWRKSPNDPAKAAWLSFVAERVPTLEMWRESFGKEIFSWEELANDTNPNPPKNSFARQLTRDWLRLVAENYFRIVTEAIRSYDSNHLILGCRFVSDVPDEVMEVAGQYCDVVSVNLYPRFDPSEELPRSLLESLLHWHEVSKKPLIISEWSVVGLDSGLPCTYGAGLRVENQFLRAQFFEKVQETFFSAPFIVGSVYFMWTDPPCFGIASPHHLENSNYGLVDETDQPYPLVIETVQKINSNMQIIRSLKWQMHGAFQKTPSVYFHQFEQSSTVDLDCLELGNNYVTVKLCSDDARIDISFCGNIVGQVFPRVVQISTGYAWANATKLNIRRIMHNSRIEAVDVKFSNEKGRSFPNEMHFDLDCRIFIPKSFPLWVGIQPILLKNADDQTWHFLDLEFVVESNLMPKNPAERTMGFGERWTPFYKPGGFLWNSGSNLGLGTTALNFEDYDFYFNVENNRAKGLLRHNVDSTLQSKQSVSDLGGLSLFFLMENGSPSHFARVVDRIMRSVVDSSEVLETVK